MGKKCCIIKCPNSIGKPKTVIHKFPILDSTRSLWLNSLQGYIKSVNINNFGVCSNHFGNDDYSAFGVLQDGSNKKRRFLRSSAIPTILNTQNHAHELMESTVMPPTNNVHFAHENVPAHTCSYISSLEKKVDDAKQITRSKTQQLHNKDRVISQLKAKIVELEERSSADFDFESIISKIFSRKQIQRLRNPDKRVNWEDSDISKAIALDSVSSKCYDYLRDTLHFPFPSRTTIKRWLSKIIVRPGILNPVLDFLAEQFKNSGGLNSVGAIAFDEMGLDERYCYDQMDDKVYGGAKYTHSTFIRGIFSKWKQVVHYDFNISPTKEKLFEIINRVESTGINIAVIISDMGTKNQGLWKELNVCQVVKGEVQQTSFTHPTNDKANIWIIPDYPHLIKLLRNHLIDSTLTLPDGTILSKSLIEDLLDVQKRELKLTFNLTHKHISVRGKQRMKVRPAFELFSAKVANAIRFAFPKKKSEAEFFTLINNFSDLMNTRKKTETHETIYKSTYGSRYEDQLKFLGHFYSYFSKVCVGRRKAGTYAPIQKGFLITVRSLIGLFEDMTVRFSAKYIMTSHLNQDFVENSFGITRGIGGFSMNLTAVSANSRMKKLIVGQRFHHSLCCNSVTKEECSFLSSESLKVMMSFKDSKQSSFPFRVPIVSQVMVEDVTEVDPHVEIREILPMDLNLYERCEEGGKEYLAGFIASKLLNQYPELKLNPKDITTENAFWVRLISDGGLIEPSALWLSYFRKFEEYFEIFHPNGKVNQDFDIVKRLSSFLTTNFKEVPHNVINFYAKTRTMIRISSLNKQIEDQKFILQARMHDMSHHKETGFAVETNAEFSNVVLDETAEEHFDELLDLL